MANNMKKLIAIFLFTLLISCTISVINRSSDSKIDKQTEVKKDGFSIDLAPTTLP